MISSNKNFQLLLWLGIISSFCALVAYTYIGFFTRYMADDYCLLINLSSAENVFIASWQKYLFTSNRFSNLFIIGFWELFPNNIAFVPAIHIIVWLTGLSWLLNEVNRLLNLKIKFLLLFFIAELLILFTFYTTPNIFQVLYWRPGQVTYLTPLVIFSIASAWLVRIVNTQPQKNLWIYSLVFTFLAFFIGGLSETISALHIAILSLALIGIYYFNNAPYRKTLLMLLSSLLIGTFSALLAMFLAPANALRINPEKSAPSIIEVILRSLDFSYAFMLDAFKTLPTPYIAIVSIFIVIAYLFFTENKPEKHNCKIAWVFFIPILVYVLIFTTFAPSAYGQSYPVERVRFPAHLMINIGLIIISISSAYLLSNIKVPAFTKNIAFALAFLVLLYPFWMARVPLRDYDDRRLWSKRWDERQVMIYTAIANGETDLLVPTLDGYEGTKELDLLPTYWANKCAAKYYGVNSISTFSIKGNILDYFSE